MGVKDEIVNQEFLIVKRCNVYFLYYPNEYVVTLIEFNVISPARA